MSSVRGSQPRWPCPGPAGHVWESLHPWGAVGGRVRGTTQPIWNDYNSLQHFTQSCGFQQSRPS